MPSASAVAVYRAVMAAGEPLGLVDAGYRAIDSLSCEKVRTGWTYFNINANFMIYF